jgi:lysophospholipase L1-like esterase
VHIHVAQLLVLLAFVASCGTSSSDSDAPAPNGISYVALGDSAGFGIGAIPGGGGYPPRLERRLRESGLEVRLVNLSVPGATARDLASLQVFGAREHAPSLVTVCVGGNDVGVDRTAAEFGADIDAILAELAKLETRVVLCNVPDVSLTPKYVNDGPAVAAEAAARVVAMNAELTRVAAARGVLVADIYQVSRERLFDQPELLSPDGFHPSAAGYEVWAEVMYPVVRTALGIP